MARTNGPAEVTVLPRMLEPQAGIMGFVTGPPARGCINVGRIRVIRLITEVMLVTLGHLTVAPVVLAGSASALLAVHLSSLILFRPILLWLLRSALLGLLCSVVAGLGSAWRNIAMPDPTITRVVMFVPAVAIMLARHGIGLQHSGQNDNN
ncbi:MAG TPA: hypothetical protein VLJ11_21240 [Bryobacteraceae bacterium]|nr:hypothetical protein [Bryobacteraceae bacterium]